MKKEDHNATKPEEFSPDEMNIEDVYGPPPWFEEDTEEPQEAEVLHVEMNGPVAVYGPPSWFRKNRNEPEEEE